MTVGTQCPASNLAGNQDFPGYNNPVLQFLKPKRMLLIRKT